MRQSAIVIAAVVCLLLGAQTARAVSILPNAVPTVFLAGAEPQSTIAYHPAPTGTTLPTRDTCSPVGMSGMAPAR